MYVKLPLKVKGRAGAGVTVREVPCRSSDKYGDDQADAAADLGRGRQVGKVNLVLLLIL